VTRWSPGLDPPNATIVALIADARHAAYA